MEENWCCLAISILTDCTPEQAVVIFEFGNNRKNKPTIRLSKEDFEGIREHKNNGLTWKYIGELFGLSESGVLKRFKKYEADCEKQRQQANKKLVL